MHPKPGAAALLTSLLHHRQQGGAAAAAPATLDTPAGSIAISAPPPTEARLPSSPRAGAFAAVAAHPLSPELHGPSLPERELGMELHADRSERHGHPGVACWDPSLPPAHAHRCAGGKPRWAVGCSSAVHSSGD